MRRFIPTLALMLVTVLAQAGIVPTMFFGLINYTTPTKVQVPAPCQGNATPATTQTCTFAQAQNAGDLNIVEVGWSGGITNAFNCATNLSDTSGNTYANAGSEVVVSSHGSAILCYAQNIASAAAGANVVTAVLPTTAAPFLDLIPAEYTGLAFSSALDVANGGSVTASTTINSGNITTTQANELLVTTNYIPGNTVSVSSGFTVQTAGSNNILADQAVTSVGTYSGGSTQTPSSWGIQLVAAFKALNAGAPIGGGIPPEAAAVGYNTITFNPAMAVGTTPGTLQKYNFFGNSEPAGCVATSGSNLVLASTAACNYGLTTATSNGGTGWTGTAFGGGGYFEATYQLSRAPEGGSSAEPAWWANDVEHQSTGNPTYTSWVEPDFFEMNVASGSESGYSDWNWYNCNGMSCTSPPGGLCSHGSGNIGIETAAICTDSPLTFPAGAVSTGTHRYGWLWVPATATTQGYTQRYIDDVAVGVQSLWNQYNATTEAWSGTGAQPANFPPSATNTIFNVIDTRHLTPIIGSSDVNVKMTLSSIKIYQASAAGNITNPVTTSSVFGVKASGSHLVSTMTGNPTVTLIGGLMLGCTQSYEPTWCAAIAALPTSYWSTTWKTQHAGTNTVRLPIDVCSYLNDTACTPDSTSAVATQVATIVANATAAGLYVVLDAHYTAPQGQLSVGQSGFMDSYHGVPFWTALTKAFGSNPAVIFDIYNEPAGENVFADWFPVNGVGDTAGLSGNGKDLAVIANGGNYNPWWHQNNGTGSYVVNITYGVYGELQALSLIRGLGGKNLVLLSPTGWAGQIDTWLLSYQTGCAADPLKNCGAAQHAYGYNSGTGPISGVLSAGFPVVETEFQVAVGNIGTASSTLALGVSGLIACCANDQGAGPYFQFGYGTATYPYTTTW